MDILHKSREMVSKKSPSTIIEMCTASFGGLDEQEEEGSVGYSACFWICSFPKIDSLYFSCSIFLITVDTVLGKHGECVFIQIKLPQM